MAVAQQTRDVETPTAILTVPNDRLMVHAHPNDVRLVLCSDLLAPANGRSTGHGRLTQRRHAEQQIPLKTRRPAGDMGGHDGPPCHFGLHDTTSATEGLMTNWSLMMLSKAARDIVASTGGKAKSKGAKQKLAHTAGYIGDLVPLLADSLTGDALTALFVCVSQAPDNVMQSKIALGSGGLTGKGFMEGTQSQLDYLPEKQTDFIFTILGEEFGFVGGIAIMAIYALVLANTMAIAASCKSTYLRLVVMGVATTFALYVIINVGMVMGTLPVVGVPLPLISYGGTVILAVMAGFGLILGAHIHRNAEPPRGAGLFG